MPKRPGRSRTAALERDHPARMNVLQRPTAIGPTPIHPAWTRSWPLPACSGGRRRGSTCGRREVALAHSIKIRKKVDADAPGAQGPTLPRSLKLLSVQGTADYAGVSTQTVRRWIKSGDLKIYRAGRQIRIDESDLVNFLGPQELQWL